MQRAPLSATLKLSQLTCPQEGALISGFWPSASIYLDCAAQWRANGGKADMARMGENWSKLMWWTAPALRHRSAIGWLRFEAHHIEGEETVHMQITTIGLDIAKNVFQVHGIDAAEKVVVRKQVRRGQVCGVLRSFAAVPDRHGSLHATAHYWAR